MAVGGDVGKGDGATVGVGVEVGGTGDRTSGSGDEGDMAAVVGGRVGGIGEDGNAARATVGVAGGRIGGVREDSSGVREGIGIWSGVTGNPGCAVGADGGSVGEPPAQATAERTSATTNGAAEISRLTRSAEQRARKFLKGAMPYS